MLRQLQWWLERVLPAGSGAPSRTVTLFCATGIPPACPGGSLGCLLSRRAPHEPLRASSRRGLNRPVAEPEVHRVLIQPRQCGGLLENIRSAAVSRVAACVVSNVKLRPYKTAASILTVSNVRTPPQEDGGIFLWIGVSAAKHCLRRRKCHTKMTLSKSPSLPSSSMCLGKSAMG